MMMPRKAALSIALPALALAACSSGSKPAATPSLAPVPTSAAPATSAAASNPATSSPATSSTPTTSGSPVTSGSPGTSGAPSTGAAPTAPGAPAVGTAVTGADTTFTAPAAATTKKFSSDCGALKDAGFTIENCVTSSSPGGTIAAFVEVDSMTSEERDLVYRKVAAGYSLVQRHVADKGAQQSVVVKSDLNDDGDAKAVFVLPASNRTFAQTLDVIDTSGQVVIHLALDGGFAKASAGGGLEAWFPSTKGGYAHDIIRYLNGKWTVISQDAQSQTQAQSEQPTDGEAGGFSS